MDLEKQSEHPVVGAILWLANLGMSLGLISVVIQALAYIYVIAWSLDRWGYFDIGLDDNLIFLEWVRWPIQQLERFIAYKQEADLFTPSDKAQIFLFSFLLTPILYMITSELSIYTIFTVPLLGFFFLLDKRLFLHQEKGEIYGKDMPRDGLPSAWSEFYELNALLWGNKSYLFGQTEAGIHIWQFVLVELWAMFQFSQTATLDPIMILWGAVSLWSLMSIFAYEFFIVGVTMEDIEGTQTAD